MAEFVLERSFVQVALCVSKLTCTRVVSYNAELDCVQLVSHGAAELAHGRVCTLLSPYAVSAFGPKHPVTQ